MLVLKADPEVCWQSRPGNERARGQLQERIEEGPRVERRDEVVLDVQWQTI